MIGFPIAVSDEVAAFHRECWVIDLHNDLLTKLTHVGYNIARRHRPAAFWNPARLDLDLPRMREGGIDALGCLMFAGFRINAEARFWRQLDKAREMVKQHEAALALADTPEALSKARAAGKTALFLGVEGSYVVEKDIDAGVRRLAGGGVRFLGPLWERDSNSGSSCHTRDDRGLTDTGRNLVDACAARGISIDVAHASRKTFWGIARHTPEPIFCSHAGAHGVSPHPRNLDDDQIREIARRGGVVGVIFVASYVGGAFAALSAVADHVEHIVRVGGAGCVALGSDFDGFMPLVRGMRDASDMPRLTQILWDRGWRPEALRKLLGENALRFFRQTWRARG